MTSTYFAPPYRAINSRRQRLLWLQLGASFLTLVISLLFLAPPFEVGRVSSEILLLALAAVIQAVMLWSRSRARQLTQKEYEDRFTNCWEEAFGGSDHVVMTEQAKGAEGDYFASISP